MKLPALRFVSWLLLLSPIHAVLGWTEFLDGSASPERPWLAFTQAVGDEAPGETIVIDLPDGGAANQALRLNSGLGAHEWYLELFDQEEVVIGARFRLVEFTPTGKENLISITTRSKHLAPAPSITLVDGRFKLWTYVNDIVKQQEIMDIGPAETNVFHTCYLFARSDGWVKLWWEGKLIYDNFVPLANPYNGYLEWGSGSWQYDAVDVIDFDWVGSGTVADLPVAISSSPAHRAIWQGASTDLTVKITSQSGLAPGFDTNKIFLTINGADRTSELAITGDHLNRELRFPGLRPDTVYQVMLTAVDTAGNTNRLPIQFDTFKTNYFTFEAEDFNFQSGQFLENIVLSSSAGPDNYLDRIGTEGVDHFEKSTDPGNVPHLYRSESLVGTERTKDNLRPAYLHAQETDAGVADFNITGVEPDEWLNYTRKFPAGSYAIYGRFAADVGAAFTARLDKVINPADAAQTTSPLGTFAFTGGRGWQTYEYVPLRDPQGNLATVNLAGPETFRITAVAGSFNANYYLLVPAAAPLPSLSIAKAQNGVLISWADAAASLESTDQLPGNWVKVPNAVSPLSVSPAAGTRYYRLSK